MSYPERSFHGCVERNCTEIARHMPPKRWKAVKSAWFGLLIGIVGLSAIVSGGDPTVVGAVTIGGLIAVGVTEVKEIEIAKYLSVTFRNGHQKEGED